MTPRRRYIALVPAYNEVDAIAGTVAEILDSQPAFDVLVIDDGSHDATAEVARGAGARVLRLPFNLGIGGALQAGYLYALEGGYEVAVQVDGDGQHDARQISKLLDHLQSGGFNMVTGSRFIPGAETGDRSSWIRRAGIRFFSAVISLLSRQRVTDPTSGFRMTDRRAIELFATDYARDYPEIEAIMLMHAHRLRSTEIPVQMRARTTGRSTIGSWQPVYYMVKVLLAVVVGMFRSRPSRDLEVGP